MVLDNLNQYQSKKIPPEKFELEIYYLHMWLAYHTSTLYLQNNSKISEYISPFINKMYILICKPTVDDSALKEEKWLDYTNEKINEYGKAFHSYITGKEHNPSYLGQAFQKNLYGEWKLSFTGSFVCTNFVMREVEDAFGTLGKELTKYEI